MREKSDIYYICGMMAAGKSTIGSKIAKALEFDFLDLDREIERIEQMTISEIFKKYGENYFREKEKEVLKNISERKKLVISLGGGTVIKKENRCLIKSTGYVIWIKSTIDDIYKRIISEGEDKRPILMNKPSAIDIKKLLEGRNKYYREVSNFEVFNSNEDMAKTVQKIVDNIKNKKNNFKIITTVGGKNIVESILIANQNDKIDLVEVRGDTILEKERKEILKKVNIITEKKMIYTYRTELEDSKNKKIESKEYFNEILEACENNSFQYVDIENSRWNDEFVYKLKKNDVKIINSHHIYSDTTNSTEIIKKIQEMNRVSCDIIKIAFNVGNEEIAKKIMDEIANWSITNNISNILALPMGEKSKEIRKNLKKWNSLGTYCYIDTPFAKGQVHIDEINT